MKFRRLDPAAHHAWGHAARTSCPAPAPAGRHAAAHAARAGVCGPPPGLRAAHAPGRGSRSGSRAEGPSARSGWPLPPGHRAHGRVRAAPPPWNPRRSPTRGPERPGGVGARGRTARARSTEWTVWAARTARVARRARTARTVAAPRRSACRGRVAVLGTAPGSRPRNQRNARTSRNHQRRRNPWKGQNQTNPTNPRNPTSLRSLRSPRTPWNPRSPRDLRQHGNLRRHGNPKNPPKPATAPTSPAATPPGRCPSGGGRSVRRRQGPPPQPSASGTHAWPHSRTAPCTPPCGLRHPEEPSPGPEAFQQYTHAWLTCGRNPWATRAC